MAQLKASKYLTHADVNASLNVLPRFAVLRGGVSLRRDN